LQRVIRICHHVFCADLLRDLRDLLKAENVKVIYG